MSELLIRSTNIEALNKVADLVRFFGLEVILLKENDTNSRNQTQEGFKNLPITYAEQPDVLALANIWKHKKINLDQLENFQEQLRQKAWGDRV